MTESPSQPPEYSPPRWHYVAVVVAVVVLYLAGVAPIWRPTPDSALYLSLARSLRVSGHYAFNAPGGAASGAGTDTIVAPGLPLILAGLGSVFGPRAYWAFNLFVALCALGALGLVYKSLSPLGGKGLALATVLATAISYPFYDNAHRVITDPVFALAFWAVVWASLRIGRGARSALWTVPLLALFTLLGVVIRTPGVMVLGPLAVGLAFNGGPRKGRWRERLVAPATILLSLALAAAGVFLRSYLQTGDVPVYIQATLKNLGAGWWRGLYYTYEGLASLPFAMAEMLTSQDAMATAPLGMLATALAVVGAIAMWRTRRRFIALTALLTVLVFAYQGGDAAVRPRYLLPILPMLIYLALQGLRWSLHEVRPKLMLRIVIVFAAMTGAWYVQQGDKPFYYPLAAGLSAWGVTELFIFLARRYGRRPGAIRVGVGVFVGIVVLTSAPRVLRVGVYETSLAYAGRYYKVARHGDHAEIHMLADFIAAHTAGDDGVAISGDWASIMFYLTDRRMVFSMAIPSRGAADAEDYVRDVLIKRAKEIRLAVVDVGPGEKEYSTFVKNWLDASPAYKRLAGYAGKRYVIYRRIGAPRRNRPRE